MEVWVQGTKSSCGMNELGSCAMGFQFTVERRVHETCQEGGSQVFPPHTQNTGEDGPGGGGHVNGLDCVAISQPVYTACPQVATLTRIQFLIVRFPSVKRGGNAGN